MTQVPIPIPIPDITPLNPPLGADPAVPPRTSSADRRDRRSYSSPQAVADRPGKAAKSADAVDGTGSLDVLRYGRMLKARRLVGVRGAGLAFDGLYYVKSVTHDIKRGEYKQSFTLVAQRTRSRRCRAVPREVMSE